MRILVAYKVSTMTRYENDPTLSEEAHHERLVQAHEAHHRSLQMVVESLKGRSIDHDVVVRGDVSDVSNYDLVVSVGGDGMVLDLSHKVGVVPILATNSDPANSVGYFCATDAEGFGTALDKALGGETPDELCRFQVAINGERVGFPILNDVLVCHTNPAAVSSYAIRFSDVSEVQKSSGIWVSTAAGSTAAIRSAGGYVMPITSSRVQYLVREPYPTRKYRYRLLKGFIGDSNRFEIHSRMPNGRVYLDGPHESASFSVSDVVTIDRDVEPLRIFGVTEKPRL